MTKSKKDFYSKTLLMLGLAGAIMGAAHAGYEEGNVPDDGSDMRMASAATREAHARMLVQTLSEEFTVVRNLASQQARFRQMGDAESHQIARMYGSWIREHKAGVPMLASLIRRHGGDPSEAKELMNPVLGTKAQMLEATHMAHEAAVRTSQMRYGAIADWDVRMFLEKRANLARQHIREMNRFHDTRH